VEGRWPRTSAGLNWYEIPISSGFDLDRWRDDPSDAAYKMRKLIFGVAPDFYEGTVGHAYKVMRETWRKWKYPRKGLVTHVQLKYNPHPFSILIGAQHIDSLKKFSHLTLLLLQGRWIMALFEPQVTSPGYRHTSYFRIFRNRRKWHFSKIERRCAWLSTRCNRLRQ